MHIVYFYKNHKHDKVWWVDYPDVTGDFAFSFDLRRKSSIFFEIKDVVSLEDVAKLHADFDLIRPFPEGNGRIGRMILFRECMAHDYPLFLIEYSRREEHFEALNNAKEDGDYSRLTVFLSANRMRLILHIKTGESVKIGSRIG